MSCIAFIDIFQKLLKQQFTNNDFKQFTNDYKHINLLRKISRPVNVYHFC